MTKALIVDDLEQNRYLLQSLLGVQGYEVVSACNGAEAMELARRDPPDVIISDILMPVMDGFTLCRQWKKDDVLKEIPFVFYTATYTEPQDEKLALDAGADRFIAKPAEPDEFMKLLRDVLAEYESGRLAPPRKPTQEEVVYLKQYNEALVRKVEAKMRQLEHANRELQRQVAECKRVEVEREKLLAHLEDKNAELERFAYTVSHDLKSPLITIKGYAGLLQKDLAANDAQQVNDDLARISGAADNMYESLEDVLELSRIGRRVNPPEDVALRDLAAEALTLVGGRISEKGVTVKIAPDLPVVYGDRCRLREVLQNLIDNAVKYLGNQLQPCIEIGSRKDGDEVVFYVRDNGMGIDPTYHEKVFGLFEQLDPQFEGTGIGLALVKRIVEIHGGRIWVESEGEGHGSTFCFTLPAGTGKE